MKVPCFASVAVLAAVMSGCDPKGERVDALDASLWSGSEWISAVDAPVFDGKSKDGARAADGASWFVRETRNSKKVASAVWMTTGLGVYEIYVNGKRIGEDALKPGFTHAHKTRRSFTYDITESFRKGAGESNFLAAEVTAGWWRDKIVNFAGKKSAFRAVLKISYDDGSEELIGTKAGEWLAGVGGPVTHAAIFDGEEYDGRVKAPYFGAPSFKPAERNDEFKGEILPSDGGEVCRRLDLALNPVSAYVWNGVDGADEPNKVFGRVRKLRDVKIADNPSGGVCFEDCTLSSGETLVVDFGQNCAGVPAFVFSAKEGTRLPPGLTVSGTTLSGTIAFKGGVARQSFSVANAGTTNRTIRVGYGPSELTTEEKPPLQVFIPRVGTNEYGWTAFETHDFDLAPGESRTLALAVDKSGFTADQTFAGLITVSDLGGTKMRVRVPVTAKLDADAPYSAAYPKGLWYGNVELVQVDRLSDGAPVTAGGTMKVNAMVLVDGTGAAHLLQRVAVGTAKEAAEDGTRAVRLWPETAAVPAEYAARRLSTVFPDMAHRSLDATSGAFGNLLQFDWTVAADARDNPFRHAWHPDHGTGFAVTNRLTLSWYTEGGESTWAYSPDEVTYGICTWTLGGLSGTGDITMRGTFALKRILSVSKVEE